MSSNGSKRVVIYDDAENLASVLTPTPAVETGMRNDAGNDYHPHFGALGFHARILFVPIQEPHGVGAST